MTDTRAAATESAMTGPRAAVTGPRAAVTGPRLDRVRAELTAAGLAALVVADRSNVAWLTGFSGSAGSVVVTASTLTLVTDGRYTLQAGTQAPGAELVIDRRSAPAVAGVLAAALGGSAALDGAAGGRAGRRIGVETHVLTVDDHAALGEAVSSVLPGAELVGAGHRLETLRRVKDGAELELLTRACAITVSAWEDLVGGAAGPLAGRTERAVVRALEDLLVQHGADGTAFATIVASGENSAGPHHGATARPLTAGDLVVVDFGARVDGYNADMTRTLFVGGPGAEQPAPWQRELHALVGRANAAGRAAAVPGAGTAAVDAAARDLIASAGHGGEFTHGLGHGIGRDVHEEPLLQATATGNLSRGEVVTVEPGVYLAGRGGVRIEDTVLVRDGDQGPEVLTASGRDLLVVT